MTIESDIAGLTVAATDLTTTVSEKIDDINAEVAAKKAEVDTFIAQAGGGLAGPNLLPDDGRFVDDAQDKSSILLNGLFDPRAADFAPYNGSTVGIEAGRYHTNSSTFGGTGTALNATTEALMNKMRPGNERYGAEFFIAEWTMGTGTDGTSANGNHYLLCKHQPRLGFTGMASFAFWLRIISGQGEMQKGNYLAKDGVEQNAATLLSPADGWTHISHVINFNGGYVTCFPRLHASQGSVIQLALPVLIAGEVRLPVHANPIPAAV